MASASLLSLAVALADWRQLYKDWSSLKTDSQKEKRSLGSPILFKIVPENQFSGKTYFYIIHPRAEAAMFGLETRARSSSSTDEERLRPKRSTLRTDFIGFVLRERSGS